jgi:FMN phosphatase YigB (HAD superfamily)
VLAGIKAVLFDIDDTLFDRVEQQRQLLSRLVAELADLFAGIDAATITSAFFESDRLSTQAFYSGSSIAASRALRGRTFMRLLGLSEDRASDVMAVYLRLNPRVITPTGQAKPVMARLAQRCTLGIISNGSQDVQYHKLSGMGIADFLRCVVLSDEVGIKKPDPGIFLRACTLLSRNPEDCLYVGDSFEVDVIGAKNVGMQTCWFNPQRKPLPDSGLMPDFEISALTEILSIIGIT